MSSDEIARQRAVIAAATEGPWEGRWLPYGGMPPEPCNFGVISMERAGIETCRTWQQSDAVFIAEARTAWPAALDEVERLQREIADAREAATDAEQRAECLGNTIEALKAENARLREAGKVLARLGQVASGCFGDLEAYADARDAFKGGE